MVHIDDNNNDRALHNKEKICSIILKILRHNYKI